MNDISLKENRRHGSLALPIKNYRMDIQNRTLLLDCHWHEEMELFKVLKGRFRFQIASNFYKVKEGDLLFVNSGELHSAVSDENSDASYLAVVFSPQMLAGTADDRVSAEYLTPLLEGRLKVRRLFGNAEEQDRKVQRSFDLINRFLTEKPFAYEIFLKASLMYLFGLLVEKGSEIHSSGVLNPSVMEEVKNVISFMQGHLDKKITVAGLAKRSGLSSAYFSRQFRRYALKSPIRYLNGMRVLRSAELLEKTDKKILDIALDCGFGSLSYYIHVFRGSMGCSPAEYRRETREGNKTKSPRGKDPWGKGTIVSG